MGVHTTSLDAANLTRASYLDAVEEEKKDKTSKPVTSS
jgi:hypothetical protein